MNTYPLDQSTKLLLSGIAAHGHEHDDAPPENPWPPLSRAALSGNVPRAPRGYVSPSSYAEEPDMDEDTDEDEPLRDYVRTKQGRDYSPDYLPSMRSRSDIRSELWGMGIAWGE